MKKKKTENAEEEKKPRPCLSISLFLCVRFKTSILAFSLSLSGYTNSFAKKKGGRDEKRGVPWRERAEKPFSSSQFFASLSDAPPFS